MKQTRRLMRVAYHEAGHAVAAFLIGAAIEFATIIPNEDCLGRVQQGRWPKWFSPDIELDGRTRHQIERHIIVLFAGAEAERRFAGRLLPRGSASDLHAAVNLATYFAPGDETGPYCTWLRIRAKNLLTGTHWPLVEAVAMELLRREHLSGRQVRKVIQGVFTG